MLHWTHRSAVIFLAVSSLLAQKSPAPSPGGTNSPTVTNNPSNNPTVGTGRTTNNPTNNTNTDPFANRPIFLAGKVMFDDGSSVNKDVRIERVCGATVHTEATVDGSGHFSFQLGNPQANSAGIADASESDSGYGRQNGGGLNQSGTFNGTGNTNPRSVSRSDATLWGCELRAAYPGYRSDSIMLSSQHELDNPNVGTIILHRLANVQGTTISVTTAEAPKSAQKNFEKGMQAARKGNVEDAEKRLGEATEQYPKYAIAWFALGQVQERQNKADEARKSYAAAIEADKHYVSPLDQLALLAARDGKWDDAAHYSERVIELNPVEFPSSFWYNTVANYNLSKTSEAAKSGAALLKLDTMHRYPEVNRLLADLSLRSKDYPGAASYLKAYLAQVPNAKDAETLKQQLLQIEQASVQEQK